jgi:hypothetical protein
MLSFKRFEFAGGPAAPDVPNAAIFSGAGRVNISGSGRLALSVANLTSATESWSGPLGFTLDVKEPITIYAAAPDPTNPSSFANLRVIAGAFGEGLAV